jgi:predicted small lipoprotein YifL
MMLRQSLYLVIVTVFLAACGQKGPLYLPDEQPATAQAGDAAPGDAGGRQE